MPRKGYTEKEKEENRKTYHYFKEHHISAHAAIIALRVQDVLNARCVPRVKRSASGASARKRQLPRVPNATSAKMPQGVRNIAGSSSKGAAPFAESRSSRRTYIALIAG